GDAGATDNQRGTPVDHAIMNSAGAVVVRIAGTEQLAAHLSLELLKSGRRESGCRAAGRGVVLVSHRAPPSGSCVAARWAVGLMAVFLGRVPLPYLAWDLVLPPLCSNACDQERYRYHTPTGVLMTILSAMYRHGISASRQWE